MNSFLLQNKQIWFFHTFFHFSKTFRKKSVKCQNFQSFVYKGKKKEGVGVGVGFERIYD